MSGFSPSKLINGNGPNLLHPSTVRDMPSLVNGVPLLEKIIYESPLEGIAFIIASIAAEILIPSLSAAFLGIGIGLCAGKFILQRQDVSNDETVRDLTASVCKYNSEYPRLQIISLVATVAICYVSSVLGFVAGLTLGALGAAILSVEAYKLFHQKNRIE